MAERNSDWAPAFVARTHWRAARRLGGGAHDERSEQERDVSQRVAACVAERDSGGASAFVARTHWRAARRLGGGTRGERSEQERET